MRTIEIVQARPVHITSLIEIAQSVEHLFGPMIGHGFENVLETNINRGATLCAVDSKKAENDVLGAIIFDVRNAPTYRVSWLAVKCEFRSREIGRKLLASALERVSPPARIEVVTFGPDNEAGVPARKLYESFGFRAGAMVERGPEGGTRQEYELQVDA